MVLLPSLPPSPPLPPSPLPLLRKAGSMEHMAAGITSHFDPDHQHTLRDRHLTGASVPPRPFSRERAMTSPVTFQPTSKPYGGRSGEEGGGVSSEGESSSPTSTSLTSSLSELEVRPRVRPRAYSQPLSLTKAADKRESSHQETHKWKHGGARHFRETASHSSYGPTSATSSSVNQAAVLNSINTQLGELLDRVGGPSQPPLGRPVQGSSTTPNMNPDPFSVDLPPWHSTTR